MRITVTTSSQTLGDILSKEQRITITRTQTTKITLQNLGTNSIYMSIGEPATVEDGVILKADYTAEEITFVDLNRIHLLSEVSDNTNIRLITT